MHARSVAIVQDMVHGRRAVSDAVSARDPLLLPVLVLNRIFQPVRITTARRAFRLLFTGTAQALDAQGEFYDFMAWMSVPVRTKDDVVPIVDGELRVPRVVHLRRYARLRRPEVRLSRRNIMLRDGYECQFCGKQLPGSQLNLDHVMPRSRGGGDTWENLVTACHACNRRKGQRTPREAGMPLRRRPVAPRWSLAVQLLVGSPGTYEEWEPFLKAG
jgi:5-methylcytosine-specific restriction endonuclease McrA